MATMSMSVRKDGFVKGVYDGVIFTALVFSEPSQYGINCGRVSKLWLTREKSMLVAYDRRWEKQPENEQIETIYHKVLAGLESLPV